MSDKIRALVVDDEELIRWSLSCGLRGIGINVDLASAGDDALEMIRKSAYDIVITDYKMSGLNGVELLEKIKAEGMKSLVIIISACLTQSIVKRAMECGAFICMSKPFGMNEILAVTQEAVKILKNDYALQNDYYDKNGSSFTTEAQRTK
ncbi:MAG: response regulator [Nitrospirae bacterium]|nr:response regulator [Nitrospirota bacterium]